MNVNFEPIMRGLKSGVFKCKICYMYAGFNCERRSGVKNVWKFVLLRGEGGGGGVGRLMVNAVLNSQFDIFCILPLVEEYEVDLFAFFVLGLFCILTIIVILYL